MITQRPAIESPSDRRAETNPCIGTSGKHLVALRVTVDDRHDYLFGLVHFIDGEHTANPSIESDKYAAPEKLVLRFTTGEVVVLGRSLARIVKALQESDLAYIQPADRRYAELQRSGVLICSISVARKEIE